jgi:hypothetical protein
VFALIITLAVSLHHKPVERHYWVNYPTRFTCEAAQARLKLWPTKATTECVEINNRI